MKRRKYGVLALVLLSIVFSLAAFYAVRGAQGGGAGAPLAGSLRAAAPLSYDQVLGTEQQWIHLGRSTAKFYGMVGEPQEESWALMRYGSYQTLVNGESFDGGTVTRDTPVFVYQAFGSVPILKGFGSASGATDMVGFLMSFDALTGHPLGATAYTEKRENVLDLSFIPEDIGPQRTLPPIPTLIPPPGG